MEDQLRLLDDRGEPIPEPTIRDQVGEELLRVMLRAGVELYRGRALGGGLLFIARRGGLEARVMGAPGETVGDLAPRLSREARKWHVL